MENPQPSPFARDDTLFGVCHALGEDFGFDPLYLRILLGVLLLWNPLAVIGGYVAAGMIVLISRWLVPNARVATQVDPAAKAARAEEDEAEPLAVAA